MPGEEWNPFLEPNPGIGSSAWYATDYGHEVSFGGTPPGGTSEVFERHHTADAPTVSQSKDQLPSAWMTNLYANAVRAIEESDPSSPLPVPRVNDEGYTFHRADPNGNTVFDDEYVCQYDAWNRLVQRAWGALKRKRDGRGF